MHIYQITFDDENFLGTRKVVADYNKRFITFISAGKWMGIIMSQT